MNNANYEKAIEALTNASGKGVQCVLDTISDILENPINMFDVTYKMLAHTENRKNDDPIWNEIMELGTFSHKTVDFFNQEGFIEAFAKSDGIAFMHTPKLKYDRTNVTIFDADGTQLGNICVAATHRPFRDEDFPIMRICSEFLSEEIGRSEFYIKMARISQDSLVSRLIDGDKSISESTMNEFYNGLKENIYVAVIDIIQYDNTLTHLEYFRNILQELKPDYKFYIYLNNIVAIMSTDGPFISLKKDLKEINEFFLDNNIYAGISDAFLDLYELKKHFKQALNALNFGLDIKTGKNIFMFYDFCLEAFMKAYPDIVSKWRHPICDYIYEYDAANKTSYAEAIYTHVLHGRYVEKTAKFLKIDVQAATTLIEEIENIFEIDFSNINSICGLLAYMKLHKCFPDKFRS